MEQHTDGPTLDRAFWSLTLGEDEGLPSILPASHLRDARDLGPVLDAGELPLWHCNVFDEDLVYLFYGGVFYRRFAMPTKNAALLPIAFLFAPCVLKSVERYYPFDTGAAEKRLYGPPWNEKLAPFKSRFRVDARGEDSAAARMVYHSFRTNHGYLFEDPQAGAKQLPDPFPLLHDFLSADLTDRGVNQRYRRIEAHSKVPIPLAHLIWVGYPSHVERQIKRLVAQLAHPPLEYRYKAFPAAPPNEIAAILQQRAHDEMIDGKYL